MALAGYNGERIRKLKRKPKDTVNTIHLSLCPNCVAMTFTLMDYDGNRYCGKCKKRKLK